MISMEITNSVKRSFSLPSSLRRKDLSSLFPKENLKLMPRKMVKTLSTRRLDSSPALSNRVRNTQASVDTVISGGITRVNAMITLQTGNITQFHMATAKGHTRQITALLEVPSADSAKKNSLPTSKPNVSLSITSTKRTASNMRATESNDSSSVGGKHKLSKEEFLAKLKARRELEHNQYEAYFLKHEGNDEYN